MNVFTPSISRNAAGWLRTGVVSMMTVALIGVSAMPAQADETCMSPYMAKIVGQ